MPVPIDAGIPYVEAAAIAVDARRDEGAWGGAWRVPGPFVVYDPVPDTDPVGATEVWLLADARALYLYVVATDPEPERIRATLGRRDTRFDDDLFAVYLDLTGDAQRAGLFAVNAAGVQGDGVFLASGVEDTSWDAVWQSSTRRTASGYEAEIAIPWRALRHRRVIDQVGLLMVRVVPRLGEQSAWPRMDPAIRGTLVQEAVVRGPGPIPQRAGLDLQPELTFQSTERGPAEPWIGGRGLSPGGTVRYRPAPSVSALATFNPDFSQVESDASQISVNRRNALYLQEKRPFFLDGQEWFSHPLGEVVYTRTIGQPAAGARLTLEPPRGSVAGLYALDRSPTASVSEGGGWTAGDLAGHEASVAVLRARRSIGADGDVGLLASDRTVLGTHLTNRVAGVDTRLRLSDPTVVSGALLGSYTTFAHGLPRTAAAASAGLSHGGRHLFFGSDHSAIAPGFRAENGFVPQADRIGGATFAGLAFRPDSAIVPAGTLTPLDLTYAWTFDGQLRELGARIGTGIDLGNGTALELSAFDRGERFGGAWLRSRGGAAWLGGPWTRWLDAEIGATLGSAPYYDPADPRVGEAIGGSGALTVRPVPGWSLGVRAAAERFVEGAQTTYEGVLAQARAELFLSRALSGRVTVDLDTFAAKRRTEALLAWERSPGTALYLGGSKVIAPYGPWTVFLKGSWLLSP